MAINYETVYQLIEDKFGKTDFINQCGEKEEMIYFCVNEEMIEQELHDNWRTYREKGYLITIGNEFIIWKIITNNHTTANNEIRDKKILAKYKLKEKSNYTKKELKERLNYWRLKNDKRVKKDFVLSLIKGEC